MLARLTLLLALTASLAHASDPFLKPTPEELSMKELAGYPGAPAVVLFYEEESLDDIKVIHHYERIKVLTEEGKRYANVELNYVRTGDTGYFGSNEMSVGEIVGRTIHPDGTIVPFTGKPYRKVIEKTNDAKFQSMVFTLPDVEIGSIIEYRYSSRYSDNAGLSPNWYIQRELFVRSAHYTWYPTSHDLIDAKERPINTITWFPILPPGVEVKRSDLQVSHVAQGATQKFDLAIKDVPPLVKEAFMPPTASYSYRVLFNFSPYRNTQDFWASTGKDWSKARDNFANPNNELRTATAAITAGATTPEDKLHKIYAAIMQLENTQYTRAHDQREDKAAGGKISNASDVLRLKRGSAMEITELFVGMARAAGLQAYFMLVPDRSLELFEPQWQSFQQFDELIAIVKIDGKDVYFDPGSRYCPYGKLAWEHTVVKGLRQIDGGTAFAGTGSIAYTANKTGRIANLTMDDTGKITGKVDLTFEGAAALGWRQASLRGDDESLRHSLRTHLEEMLPHSLEIKVDTISPLSDYEQPLKVTYTVEGTLGSPTGKRLVLPADLFESGASDPFAQPKRETAVYFHYPQSIIDALRITFVKGFTVEAVPTTAKFDIPKRAIYSITTTSTPTSFTTRRNYLMGDILFTTAEYPDLKTFYGKFQATDRESVILKTTPTTN